MHLCTPAYAAQTGTLLVDVVDLQCCVRSVLMLARRRLVDIVSTGTRATVRLWLAMDLSSRALTASLSK